MNLPVLFFVTFGCAWYNVFQFIARLDPSLLNFRTLEHRALNCLS